MEILFFIVVIGLFSTGKEHMFPKMTAVMRGASHDDWRPSSIGALISEIRHLEYEASSDWSAPFWRDVKDHGSHGPLSEGGQAVALYGVTATGESKAAAAVNWVCKANQRAQGLGVAE